MNNMEQQPIQLYLLSGFLGSGKTTLLKRLIDGYSDRRRLGLLVNEFGSVGIDGGTMKDQDVKMVEINNGSIFCACLKDGFMRTLKAFTEQPIDTLIIENSGMADPSSMNSILERMAPYFKRPYDYRGSICLVDSQTFLDYVELLMPTQNQIRSSDLILVNKTDLVPPEQIEEIHEKIGELNPGAFVYDTSYAEIPLELLDSRLSNHGYQGESSTSGIPYRMNTFVLQAKGEYEPEALSAFCEAVQGHIWRIKGFLRSPGMEGWVHVDGTSGGTELREAAEESVSPAARHRLVVICRGGEDLPDLLRSLWTEHCGDTPSIS
ncbi:MAG: GTP-binding protein [Fretibacterium sp.]|nr:GTP-binding protein [Fretibacterium sp.]